MRIGIFDSGIGGLTVLKELVGKYPHNEYIYIGDTLNVPYGDKNKEDLIKFSSKIIDYFIAKNTDIIVIACGTVSSNILEELLKIYSIPIIDIISPTIEYIKKNNYDKIGVIATHMTIQSRIFENNLDNIDIKSTETPQFVSFIENNNNELLDKYIDLYLKQYIDSGIKLLVLGCTHYPLIQKNIDKYFFGKIKILNMAIPLLDTIKLTNCSNKVVVINFTMLNNNIINNVKKILNGVEYTINKIEL